MFSQEIQYLIKVLSIAPNSVGRILYTWCVVELSVEMAVAVKSSLTCIPSFSKNVAVREPVLPTVASCILPNLF